MTREERKEQTRREAEADRQPLGVRQRRTGPTGAVVDRAGRRTNPKGVQTYFRVIRVAIRRSVHGRIRAWRGSLMGS
jgi:hypothetical protein